MHMRVNESGDHQLSARVNHLVSSAVEALADKDDLRALVDEFGVAPEHMAAARIADKPAALDLRSHVAFLLWARQRHFRQSETIIRAVRHRDSTPRHGAVDRSAPPYL